MTSIKYCAAKARKNPVPHFNHLWHNQETESGEETVTWNLTHRLNDASSVEISFQSGLILFVLEPLLMPLSVLRTVAFVNVKVLRIRTWISVIYADFPLFIECLLLSI